jgi:hypothetical protein
MIQLIKNELRTHIDISLNQVNISQAKDSKAPANPTESVSFLGALLQHQLLPTPTEQTQQPRLRLVTQCIPCTLLGLSERQKIAQTRCWTATTLWTPCLVRGIRTTNGMDKRTG